jgi:hypothetical protein
VGPDLEPHIEGLFWVRVTVPENCRGLVSRQHLMLRPGDDEVVVLRWPHPLGVLGPDGRAWVRSHGSSACSFVRYGSDRTKRFQVRIVAA